MGATRIAKAQLGRRQPRPSRRIRARPRSVPGCEQHDRAVGAARQLPDDGTGAFPAYRAHQPVHRRARAEYGAELPLSSHVSARRGGRRRGLDLAPRGSAPLRSRSSAAPDRPDPANRASTARTRLPRPVGEPVIDPCRSRDRDNSPRRTAPSSGGIRVAGFARGRLRCLTRTARPWPAPPGFATGSVPRSQQVHVPQG